MWGMMKEPLGITFPSISTSSKQVLGRLIAPTNIVLNFKKNTKIIILTPLEYDTCMHLSCDMNSE